MRDDGEEVALGVIVGETIANEIPARDRLRDLQNTRA
jgi:hypothetical protein